MINVKLEGNTLVRVNADPDSLTLTVRGVSGGVLLVDAPELHAALLLARNVRLSDNGPEGRAAQASVTLRGDTLTLRSVGAELSTELRLADRARLADAVQAEAQFTLGKRWTDGRA